MRAPSPLEAHRVATPLELFFDLVLLLLAPFARQPVLMIGFVLALLLAGKLALQPADTSGHEAW